MALTVKLVEELIDLVEIKLSCVEVFDAYDRQSVERLKRCRDELYGLVGKKTENVMRESAAAA